MFENNFHDFWDVMAFVQVRRRWTCISTCPTLTTHAGHGVGGFPMCIHMIFESGDSRQDASQDGRLDGYSDARLHIRLHGRPDDRLHCRRDSRCDGRRDSCRECREGREDYCISVKKMLWQNRYQIPNNTYFHKAYIFKMRTLFSEKSRFSKIDHNSLKSQNCQEPHTFLGKSPESPNVRMVLNVIVMASKIQDAGQQLRSENPITILLQTYSR